MSRFIPLQGILNAKQQEFIDSEKRIVAIGGGRGLGKSWAIRRVAIKYAMEHERARVLILRRTRSAAYYAIRMPIRVELNGVAKEYASMGKYTFPNGSVINVRNCELEQDVHQFAGKFYDMICVDEAQEFAEYQLTFLSHCGIPKPLMRYSITIQPNADGLAMLKRQFVEKRYFSDETPEDFELIRAATEDNPFLDKNYKKQLEALPEKLRKQLLGEVWE